MTDDVYGGYVSVSKIDGSDVKIEAGSVENGYRWWCWRRKPTLH